MKAHLKTLYKVVRPAAYILDLDFFSVILNPCATKSTDRFTPTTQHQTYPVEERLRIPISKWESSAQLAVAPPRRMEVYPAALQAVSQARNYPCST